MKHPLIPVFLLMLTGAFAQETPSVSSSNSWTGQLPKPLTPPAPQVPRINGPSVFGVRPGSPVLHTIPATGERPMSFDSKGLPEGLSIDSATGRITGQFANSGTNTVTLIAKNAMGESRRSLRIIVGDRIALTPPMGWSSWNCWGGQVSQQKVISSAEALKAAGLDRHGWTFVNIDDGWQGKREGRLLAIQPNSKFPDMKALGERIHALGV